MSDHGARVLEGSGRLSAKLPQKDQQPPRVILVQLNYPSSPFPGPNLPIGIGYLAEQLELHGIPYHVADLSFESRSGLLELISATSPEFVGLSMMSLDVESHYAVAAEIKKLFPAVKIVAGGPHISFIRSRSLQDCPSLDYGVVFEGEQTLVELLVGNSPQSIKGLLYRDAGGVAYTGDRPLVENLDRLPFPRYRKFKLQRYGATISLASSRGCPFSCTFCGAHLSMGRKWRARSVQDMMAELEYWQQRGYESFNFVDSNFFMSKERVMSLCDCLSEKKLSISITSDGMRANDADPLVLGRLKEFGLKGVAVGIESANDDILKSIKKGETLAELERCLETLLELRISAIAFFIIGLPGETVEHVLNTFRFALRYPNIASAYFFNPNPLPGTELYSLAEQQHMLRGSEAQIFQNIGGMGKEILLETEELPIAIRRKLMEVAQHVSRLVQLRHYGGGLPAGPERAALEAEMGRLSDEINRGIVLLDHDDKRTGGATAKPEPMDGHLSAAERDQLKSLAASTRGNIFVEVGSHQGAYSCVIASGIASGGSDATLFCVDSRWQEAAPPGESGAFADFMANTAGSSGIVVPLRGRSHEIAVKFFGKVDILFVNAGRTDKGASIDVAAWFPTLKPGALVVVLDLARAEGVQRLVKSHIHPFACNERSLPNMYWAHVSFKHLSVIIPTRNRAALLYNALESLTRQSYPAALFEVIVVDSGSTDPTAEVCRHFQRRIGRFRHLCAPRPGLHDSRHAGVGEACGEIVVYAADDIEASPTWLQGVAESFNDPEVALVGGKILPAFEARPPEWVAAPRSNCETGWSDSSLGVLDFGDTVREIPHEHLRGCNLSIRKDVWELLGGLLPDCFPQEPTKVRGNAGSAVSCGVKALGFKALYNPKAAVYRMVPSSRLAEEYPAYPPKPAESLSPEKTTPGK